MTLVLIEGFETIYLPSRLPEKGWLVGNSYDLGVFDVDYGFPTGRVTGKCFRLTSGGYGGNQNSSLIKFLPSSYSKVFIGFGWKRVWEGDGDPIPPYGSGTGTGYTHNDPYGAILIVTDDGNFRGYVGCDADRKLYVYNYNTASIVGTGSTALTPDEWNYIEFMIHLDGASGSFEVRLNGANEIGPTTSNFGSSTVNRVYLWSEAEGGHPANNGYAADFDDIYVQDDSGSFLGDVVVETIFPASEGANADWTPDSGSVHYSRVNESTGTYPDNDTSYVSSSTVGDYDTYDMGSLRRLADDDVYAVQVNLSARKDDGSTRKVKDVVRHDGANDDGTESTLTSSYATYSTIREQDPDAVDWTKASVDAAEFGVKETA